MKAILKTVLGVLIGLSGLGLALAEAPKEINIGVAAVGLGGRPYVGSSVSAVAHVKGWLEDEFKADGIQVNWHFFKTAGPGVNEAYSNGRLDFAWQGDLPQLIGKTSGLKTKLILGSSRRQYFYLAARKDSTAKSVDDIRGRSVAIQKGTCPHLSIARLLAAHGLKEKDLKVYNLDALASVAALSSGDLELAFGSFNLFSARDQGLVKIIYSGAEDGGKYGCSTGFTVTEGFAGRYPELTRRVVKVLVRAAHWAAQPQNRTELYQIWAKSGVDVGFYREEWDSQDLQQKLSPLIDDYQVNRYRVALEDAKQFGLARGSLDFDRWIDRSYLDAALAELKLETFWKPEGGAGKP